MTRQAACAVTAMFATALACSSHPNASFTQKLVIVGFDGMHPDLVERWIEEGKLPTFAALAAQGGLHRLETTHSPDTATSWASFATGVNPGKHRVFDLVSRDPRTYVPRLSMLERQPPRLLFDALPIARARTTTTRAGTSFWVTAGAAGVRSTVVGVPMTFPPEEVPNGQLLAGFPLPDVSGNMGNYHYFASELATTGEGLTDFGGHVGRLEFQSRRATAELVGPRDPRNASDASERRVRLPFSVVWNHEDRSANVEIGGQTVHLLERQWSRWIEIEFALNWFSRTKGLVQFYLIDAGQQLQLYASPVHWNPAAPQEAISSPPALAAAIESRLGAYRTLSWPATAWAVADGHLDEAAFMEDLEREFDDRAETILNRIDARDWDLLVGVIEAPDRVQHVMWRLIDPSHPAHDSAMARVHGRAIERMYRRADTFIGELLRHLEPDTVLMIVSTHGFQTFRSAVNLNSWLVEKGYMSLGGRVAPRRRFVELFDGDSFWENVDWGKTRAYSLGFGQVFVNLKGRERDGTVREGADYEQLLDALLIDLMNFHDERTYDRVVANVYKRNEIYSGPFVGEAPDLLVALAPTYRVSWQTAVGGTPPASIEANRSKWSGDHRSADHRTIPGVFLSNRTVTTEALRVIDIAPTVLKYFGLAIPADVEGTPFIE